MTDTTPKPEAISTMVMECALREMELRGYQPGDLHEHTSDCEYDTNSQAWSCYDENGVSHHPMWDEFRDVRDVIGRALEFAWPMVEGHGRRKERAGA